MPAKSKKPLRTVVIYGLLLKLFTSGKFTVTKKPIRRVASVRGRRLTLEKSGKRNSHDDIGKEDTGWQLNPILIGQCTHY